MHSTYGGTIRKPDISNRNHQHQKSLYNETRRRQTSSRITPEPFPILPPISQFSGGYNPQQINQQYMNKLKQSHLSSGNGGESFSQTNQNFTQYGPSKNMDFIYDSEWDYVHDGHRTLKKKLDHSNLIGYRFPEPSESQREVKETDLSAAQWKHLATKGHMKEPVRSGSVFKKMAADLNSGVSTSVEMKAGRVAKQLQSQESSLNTLNVSNDKILDPNDSHARLNKRLANLSPEKSRPGLKTQGNKKILDDETTSYAKKHGTSTPVPDDGKAEAKPVEENYTSKKPKRTEQPRKDMYVDIAKRRVILGNDVSLILKKNRKLE